MKAAPQPSFSESDLTFLKSQGISEADASAQIRILRRGFLPVELDRPCTLGDGIRSFGEAEARRLKSVYESEVQAQGRAMKFVPASGAASRMFSLLSAYYHMNRDLSSPVPPEGKVLEFFQNVMRFPFHSDLEQAMGTGIERHVAARDFLPILKALLTPQGLNYEKAPKALIPFHQYGGESRTALEEQLVEAGESIRDRNGLARVHFTVTADTLPKLRSALEKIQFQKSGKNIRWDVSLSLQNPDTQTLSLDETGEPFREAQGRLLLRPGGHGSLLANLQDLDSEVVFIKNIDNVLPEGKAEEHHLYKKIIGGLLWELRTQAFALLSCLEAGEKGDAIFEDSKKWAASVGYSLPENISRETNREKKMAALRRWLNRPIRVCGVVKNVGEPGGGPFWVRSKEEAVTPQIVESAQIDLKNAEQEAIFRRATHFNPVDLVCLLKDFQGRSFELKDFVDPDTWFLSKKTEGGKSLQALERPGLWNGSMAGWLTVFVEVPLATFNPVKTVFDLLRPEHQA